MRVGILTSGGDAPGMNAVIAAAAERIEELDGQAVGVVGGFAGLAEARAEPIVAASARAHGHEAGTWLTTSRWPALASADGLRACRDGLASLGVDALLVIGGHGSAAGARALAGAQPIALVPATIDRDVAGTEAAIGMDSAIAYALAVIDRLKVSARSLPGRAFLLQTLGAPHGHLAAAVAAAAGLEEVLVPERPLDLDGVARRLRECAASGEAIAVMSEAVGDAVSLSAELARRADIRVNPSILGHAQRAAVPSARDLAMGDAAGRAAAVELVAGRSSFVALTASGAVIPVPLLARDTERR